MYLRCIIDKLSNCEFTDFENQFSVTNTLSLLINCQISDIQCRQIINNKNVICRSEVENFIKMADPNNDGVIDYKGSLASLVVSSD